MAHHPRKPLIKQQRCPLCESNDSRPYYRDKREYYRCPSCFLVFVLAQYHLTSAEEKAVYDQHENSATDPGYRKFLGRVFDPLSQHLCPQSNGLDFGSGPGPALSLMLEEAGHSVQIYDPFYAPDRALFKLKYEFITATEVLEHLHFPGKELDLLWSCLKQDGVLAIMTKRILDHSAFASWHYKNDPTHVCFFAIETFQWLARKWDAALKVQTNDVVMLIKNE
ncbi:MAG: class I SAM-dependent methyltransferase [Xanthomonadales bacterium]|nr:class I SAM-dependent methyltransferase [Xanthomonadales bacterium]